MASCNKCDFSITGISGFKTRFQWIAILYLMGNM
jgi:hypothetical protein